MLLVFSFAPLFCEFSVKNVFGQKLKDTAELRTLMRRELSGRRCLTLIPHVRHCSIPILAGLVNGFKWIPGVVTTWCHPLERGWSFIHQILIDASYCEKTWEFKIKTCGSCSLELQGLVNKHVRDCVDVPVRSCKRQLLAQVRE